MVLEDVVRVVQTIGIKKWRIYAKDVQIACPLAEWTHSKKVDKNPSMGLTFSNEPGPSLVNCFACGFNGTLYDLVMQFGKMTGLSFDDLLSEVLLLEAGSPEGIIEAVERSARSLNNPPERILSESFIEPFRGKTTKEFLKRGLIFETMRSLDIGFDKEIGCATIPVRNMKGQLVGVIGRRIRGEGSKYYDYEGFEKSRYLLGENLVRYGSVLVVVEGALDWPAIWQLLDHANMFNAFSAVSTMGCMHTKMQRKKIIDLAEDVILFYDFDGEGIRAAEKMNEEIGGEVKIRSVMRDQFYNLPKGKHDVNSLMLDGFLTSENIIKILDDATFLF